MKNLFIILCVALFCSFTNQSYSQAVKEGSMIVSAGYGWPNIGKYLLKAVNDGNTDAKTFGFGPIHARFEYVLTEKWGIGASINYASFGSSWSEMRTNGSSKSEINANTINFLVRINRHYDVSKKVDIYWGAGVGYNNYTLEFKSDDPTAEKETLSSILPIGFESVFGLRYFINNNFALYTELGWSKSIMQGGIAYKF